MDDAFRGCFTPGVTTFDRFAEDVLREAKAPVRGMGRLMKRRLVRRLIDEQVAGGGLKHFGPIASTVGLVDLMSDFICEMKRLEIWPEDFRRACQSRGMTDKDAELSTIYEEYQKRLTANNLYDAEGLFWSARRLLREGQRRPFERLQFVAVDGFADFTRTQHEILELIADRVDDMWITLPVEAEPVRADLFNKSIKTMDELLRRYSNVTAQLVDRRESFAWPAMRHIEKHIFEDPRVARPASDTVGVEILAAAQKIGEIKMIASQVKRLLAIGCATSGGQPVRPDEICIVFRSVDEWTDLIRETFEEFGVSVALESSEPLVQSRAVCAMVNLLRLDLEDWPFRDLLALLGNSYFKPDWLELKGIDSHMYVEGIIRRLQIPSGKRRLLDRLETAAKSRDGRSAAQAEAGSIEIDGKFADWHVMAQTAHAVLLRLDELFADFPVKATLSQWASIWATLAEQTGLARVIGAGEDDSTNQTVLPHEEFDLAAWDCLMESLKASETLSRWLGEGDVELDRHEAFAALLDIVGSVKIGRQEDEDGAVKVLSASGARALEIPYLFFAGLSEGSFPRSDRQDRLYSDAESQRLIEAGLPLVARSERNSEEMLLFYEVLTRATKRLWLSYAALDQAAQPLSPSPYLRELEYAFGGVGIQRTEAVDLSLIPPGDEPATPVEFRIKAIDNAIGGNVSFLAGLLRDETSRDLANNILAGLYLGDDRLGHEFGRGEGMLKGDSVHRAVAMRYPAGHVFRATELERYASCPFRFYMESVLGVSELEGLELSTDRRFRGSAAHAALVLLHKHVSDAFGESTSPAQIDVDRYELFVHETIGSLFSGDHVDSLVGALREIDRRVTNQWLLDYRGQCEDYDKLLAKEDVSFRSSLFEVSFGESNAEFPSSEKPLECLCDGTPIHISGRLDRLDIVLAGEEAVFNVLDYKTGGPIKFDLSTVLSGEAIQLPIYICAAEELLLSDERFSPWRAGYWYVRDRGFAASKAVKCSSMSDDRLVAEKGWETMREGLFEVIGAIVGGIRSGEFPVYSSNESCSKHCPFKTVCRISHVRSLEKIWRPTKRD